MYSFTYQFLAKSQQQFISKYFQLLQTVIPQQVLEPALFIGSYMESPNQSRYVMGEYNLHVLNQIFAIINLCLVNQHPDFVIPAMPLLLQLLTEVYEDQCQNTIQMNKVISLFTVKHLVTAENMLLKKLYLWFITSRSSEIQYQHSQIWNYLPKAIYDWYQSMFITLKRNKRLYTYTEQQQKKYFRWYIQYIRQAWFAKLLPILNRQLQVTIQDAIPGDLYEELASIFFEHFLFARGIPFLPYLGIALLTSYYDYIDCQYAYSPLLKGEAYRKGIKRCLLNHHDTITQTIHEFCRKHPSQLIPEHRERYRKNLKKFRFFYPKNNKII